jgi:hypothetical protein
VARSLELAGRDPDGFLWVSLENTDRELVRFVSTRTSVRESILAQDDLSALLNAFTGRAATRLPAGNSRDTATRAIALTRGLYGDERTFYQLCRERDVNYVVYSIDFLLDSGRYSPRYRAAIETITPESIVYRMHFEPEALDHFTLLYENDHYRLYRVSAQPALVFLSDHPPVYQKALLAASGGSTEAFRQNVAALMITYADGVAARAVGDYNTALRLLGSCVANAPYFTRARLELAEVYMDLERYQDAMGVVTEVVAYAPDNSLATYHAAYISARLGRFAEAKSYLKLLRSHERDPELMEKADLLQAYMEQGEPQEQAAPDSD